MLSARRTTKNSSYENIDSNTASSNKNGFQYDEAN